MFPEGDNTYGISTERERVSTTQMGVYPSQKQKDTCEFACVFLLD